MEYKTRRELEAGGEIRHPPYSYLSQAYYALLNNKTDESAFFHSDVFYVRAALEKRTGLVFPLDEVEDAMIAEGWRKSKKKRKKDVSRLQR